MSTLETVMVLMWAVLGNLFGGYTPSGVSLSNRSGYRALSALAMSAKADVLPLVRTRKVRTPKTRKLVVNSLQWKAGNKARKAAMGRKAHEERCEALYKARKARSAAMEWHTVANEEAAALKAAVVFMTGKSWQDAIGALYKEGKLVSMRSKGVVSPAVHEAKTVRAATGKSFLVAKAGIKSIAQKDAEYVSTHKVVGTSRRIAPTWSMWQKVVPIGRVLLLVQRRDAAVEKANRMAIQALERHLKIAAWEAVQAAKKVAA